MSKSAVYAIPVRPHVRQYLIKRYGPDTWDIHQNTFLGRTVRMMVEKLPFRQLDRPEVVTGSVVRLKLPTALKHYSLTPEAVREIGEQLDKFFVEQMIEFVLGQVAVTQNERAALRCFFNLYNINPDDYDLEVARKAYRDYKDRVLKGNGAFELLYENGGGQLRSDYAIAS